jgi:hypothetical protein
MNCWGLAPGCCPSTRGLIGRRGILADKSIRAVARRVNADEMLILHVGDVLAGERFPVLAEAEEAVPTT